MKVTVCFGPVSVVVPCGNGEIPVRDLIAQAITRYRKASNKSSDFPVAVGALRSSDGAILDPDDRLADVVDDREQLVACLTGTEADSTGYSHHQFGQRMGIGLRGDGTSASSNSGSPSPDFLRGCSSRKDIEVTGEEAPMTSDLLQVRRGSEPALNRISQSPGSNPALLGADSHTKDYKRWSAAPIVDPQSDSEEERRVVQRHPSGPRFARSGARVSMQIFGGGNSGYRWAEAADNALLSSAVSASPSPSPSATHLPPDYEETMHRRTRSLRREPVGATSEPSALLTDQVLVVLPNEGGPLGIHVVPDYSPSGTEMGLLVQGIEAGGRIHRDGRIAVQDRIIEINSHPLKDVPFQRAQELFRNALQSRELRLRIMKSGGSQLNLGPSPTTDGSSDDRPLNGMVQSEEHMVGASMARVAAVSPTRKSTSAIPGTRASALMTVSTRKIGKKLDLELTKGSSGLGFSVTTRDNPAGGQCPIYIKNILPKGAAIEDGRLKSGDRLLEVNGIEITGKSQDEVVTLLRNIPAGGIARLLISRQADSSEEETSPKLPRQMKSVSRASEESLLLPWKQREILTLDIPVHDTEKAGLGISVKGKTTTTTGGSGTTDLGIFIKSVLHGGAASRDGRLSTNDQLLHVNGVSLLGRSNTEAMEALRRAVHQEGPKPGHITLTVARKVHSSLKDREAEGQADDTNGTIRIGGSSAGDSSSSYDQSTGSSDQSGSTVIFVSGATDSRSSAMDRLAARNNESYYRATHETWNTTQQFHEMSKSVGGSAQQQQQQANSKKQNSPTVQLTPSEVVSIDGDYLPQPRPRPPPVNASSMRTSPDMASPPPNWSHRLRAGPIDGRDWPEPQSPSEKDSVRSDRPSDSDAPTYASQTSLEDPNAGGFSRDQFGRQSMSEKRHAALDAKNTDTYQRNKKLREERERQKQAQQESQQEQQQAAKENVPPPSEKGTFPGRVVTRRGVKRRHAHPLVSRLEREYLNSPPYHRSSPNLYHKSDVAMVSALRRSTVARGSRLTMAPMQGRVSSVESLLVSSAQSPRFPVVSTVVADIRRFRSPKDIGPTLGLKKSSSLESLQTVVQEIQMQEEETDIGCYGYRPNAIRVVRGRGCNDSFRAAVDRSYEPIDTKEPMETLDEEVADNDLITGTTGHRVPETGVIGIGMGGGIMINNKSEIRKSKKKAGLLRGLGSMFRFGKHRKSGPPSPELDADTIITSAPVTNGGIHERRPSGPAGLTSASSARSDVDRHHVLRRTLPPDDRDRAELGRQMAMAAARQAAQDEQKRIQQHYLRLMEQQGQQSQHSQKQSQPQQQPQQQQQQQQQQEQVNDSVSRSQRLHQLRAQHQKRHAERQGTYSPPQQFEQNKGMDTIEIVHARSSSYDPYNGVRKPRSRAAVGEPTAFVPVISPTSGQQIGSYNQEDFNLNRRQQHYHSQRSARETRVSPSHHSGGTNWSGLDGRPVSNYFEYESLHIAGHTVALTGPPYKPQQSQMQHSMNRRMANPMSNMVVPEEMPVGASFLRQQTRNSSMHSNDYGSHGRSSQRETVYLGAATPYGSGNSRPAPLAGSKV